MKLKTIAKTMGLVALISVATPEVKAQSYETVNKWYLKASETPEYRDKLLDLFDRKLYAKTKGQYMLANSPNAPLNIVSVNGEFVVEVRYNNNSGFEGYINLIINHEFNKSQVKKIVALNEEARIEEIEIRKPFLSIPSVKFIGNPNNYDGSRRNTNVFWPSKEFYDKTVKKWNEEDDELKPNRHKTVDYVWLWFVSDGKLKTGSKAKEVTKWLKEHKGDTDKYVFVKDVLKLIGYDVKNK